MKEQSMVEFFASVEAFSAFTPEELLKLAGCARERNYDFGQAVFEEGEPGEGLFVIKSGRVRLFVMDGEKEKSIDIRKEGDTFSEISILKMQKNAYSARSSDETAVLFIPHESFQPIISTNPAALNYLTRYIALKLAGGVVTKMFGLRNRVDRDEMEQIIKDVGIKRVRSGDRILAQDTSEDKRLYIVREGEVRIVREDGETEYQLFTHGPGEVFGEKSCLMYSSQQASAVAGKDSTLIVIPQKTVYRVMEKNGDLRSILEERINHTEKEIQRQLKLSERRRKRVLFDIWSKPKTGEKVIKRFPLVEQAEAMDCGAACLAMICKHYDIPLTMGKLREMANVTTEGATMESLSRVGESLGFVTKGIRCAYQSLLGLELPFIAHWEGYHFIIVYGISKNKVWVADPGLGFRKLTREEFERGWSGSCLLFSPTASLVKVAVGSSPWLRFVGYLKPFKKVLIDLLVASLVIQILGLAPPIIIQNILDRVVVHRNYHLLNMMIIGLAVAMIFTQLTGYLTVYLSNFMVRKLDFTMIGHFYKHVLSLPMGFFNKRKTGDIIARFQENETIRQFTTFTSITTILNVFMVFIYLTVMFIYNVKLTLILLLFLPPIVLVTVLATPTYKEYARKAFTAGADQDSLLVETLSGAETVKAMGAERPMRLKWEKKYAKMLDVHFRGRMFGTHVGLASQALKIGSSLTLLWLGSKMVLQQELTIGQLMAFNALMGSVLAPLLGLVGVWDEFNEALVSMERLGDVLDLEPEQRTDDISTRIILTELRGDIRFENVYFRYGGNETPYVLENINLEIEAGTTVAIVGLSGSGKTTLAKMLVGFFMPTEGTLSVDGYDMTSIDLEYFRSQIGYVMQNNLLFSGSVSENIAIGDQKPDSRRITEVAKLADAHGFISNMTLGYEQIVGERGTGLSGGQIQRICIARALYNQPRLLVFDEATSALDSDSESHIQNNMKEILKGRTAVVIAHRLSTIMNADKILVLYDGAIVEEGAHQELLQKKGMYYHLVQKQISSGQGA